MLNNINDNDIWIYTGNSSGVAFDAIKIGNDTMNTVYPISAKQYVGGAWVDKVAKSYQGGEWVDWWNGYLFDNGIIPSFVTEWKSNKNDSTLTLTVGNTIHAFAKNYGLIYCYPSPAIDVTPYSKFVVDIQVDHASESNDPNVICISKAGTDVTEAATHISGTSRTTLELDISAFEGEYYCGFLISSWKGADTNAYVYSMKLVQ